MTSRVPLRPVMTGTSSCAASAADQVGDAEPREGGCDPDEGHLQAAPRWPPDRGPGLPPADSEQGERAHAERDDYPEDEIRADYHKRDQRDEGAQDRGDPDKDCALPRLSRVHGRKVQLVGHHDFEPRLRLRDDFLQNLVQLRTVEVPALEDLP